MNLSNIHLLELFYIYVEAITMGTRMRYYNKVNTAENALRAILAYYRLNTV